jgi:hypothetical protein
MCKVYGIQQQFTAPQWSNCNNMAKQMIKTIKHDIIVLVGFLEYENKWDSQLQ